MLRIAGNSGAEVSSTSHTTIWPRFENRFKKIFIGELRARGTPWVSKFSKPIIARNLGFGS